MIVIRGFNTLAAAYIRCEHPVQMVQNLRLRLTQAAAYPGLGLCLSKPQLTLDVKVFV